MKLKQVIWKDITNTDLQISNSGIIKSKYGGAPMNIVDMQDLWLDFFTEEEMNMVEDDEETLEDLYIDNSGISLDDFLNKK